jgi:hypothetical protein
MLKKIALISTILFAFSTTSVFQAAAAATASATVTVTPKTNCTPQAGTNQMAILAPCSTTVVTANQVTAPAPFAIAISDAAASVLGTSIPITVQAKGMTRVEVWMHGVLATTLTAGANGIFTGTITPLATDIGPLRLRFNAYNVAVGSTPTIQLTGEYTLIRPGTPALVANPAAAAGMTKIFDDTSIGKHVAPGCAVGTWPRCTTWPTLSVASGVYYLPKQFNGQDYGNAANMSPNSGSNPYTVLPSGDTRIRTTWSASFVDPYGYHRNAYSGFISTLSVNGTSAIGTVGDGYYELTWMIQNGTCGKDGNNTCSVGSWPSFWALWSKSCPYGCETDGFEQYGNDVHYYQAGTHRAGGGLYLQLDPYPNNPWGMAGDWHTSGVVISGGGTNACMYLDNVKIGCGATAGPGAVGGSWVWMITQALGGGWVTNAPPAGYIDFYVRQLRIYKK